VAWIFKSLGVITGLMLLATACPAENGSTADASASSAAASADLSQPEAARPKARPEPRLEPRPEQRPAIDFRVRPAISRSSQSDFDPQRWVHSEQVAQYLHPSVLDPLPAPRTAARQPGLESNLMELRWHMGVSHAAIPTFEIGGCDLISPRYFGPHIDASTAAPQHGIRRARQLFSNAVSGFVHTGCS
jgi:hypothetical protein